MKTFRILLFFFILLGVTASAWGGEVFLRSYSEKIHDAVLVGGTTEVCSAAVVTSRIQFMSIQWIATSVAGTANIRIFIQGSLDESNFVVPENLADIIASDTTESWRLTGIHIPMVRTLKICVKGVASNPADTVVTAWIAEQ